MYLLLPSIVNQIENTARDETYAVYLFKSKYFSISFSVSSVTQ